MSQTKIKIEAVAKQIDRINTSIDLLLLILKSQSNEKANGNKD